MIDKISREILSASYWEHFKKAKDLALYLPLDHPSRKELEREMNSIREKLEVKDEKNQP